MPIYIDDEDPMFANTEKFENFVKEAQAEFAVYSEANKNLAWAKEIKGLATQTS